MNGITKYKFTNWAKNQSCVAANYYQPTEEQQLIGLVKSNPKIRLTGTGHSWNNNCLTPDTLINLDNYNKVLHLDKDKLQVRVQAGAKLWQLNAYLDKHGLALANLGSIARQSVAGAISTATHGTGINFQILGSQLQNFTLIKPDGERVVVDKDHDKELFNLALVNLGCLGIISEVTINAVPAFNLHDQTYVADFDEVVNNLDELLNTTDHFKLWWFPHTNKLVVYRYNRTQQAANDSRLRQWAMDEFLSVNVYRLLLKIGHIKRDWRRGINSALVQKFISPLNRIEKSYKVFNVPEPPLHRETEWAFDVSQAKALLTEYRRMINASNHRINFIQEVRFTKADDYALSPCYGRNTVWIGAYNADNFGWDELLADFCQLAKQYNGRPHWGKEFCGIDATYFEQAYPQFNRFKELRARFDPEAKFENSYVRNIFG